jgi:hypothetical protein
MSILNAVTNVKPKAGIRMVVSGVEKMGKTTFLASAPRPVLVPLEQGYQGVNMHMTPLLETYEQVMSFLDEVIAARGQGTFPYQTICFDSVTALERMIHQSVLETDPTFGKGNKKALTMESALGGYGKAYTYANELFANFLTKCDVLSSWGGINIAMTCHVFSAAVEDPTVGNYSTWDLLLHSPKNQKTYGKREHLTQWADVIGFIYEPLIISAGSEKNAMQRGISKGVGRVLAMTRTPSYVAGNRFQVTEELPLPIQNGWNVMANAIYQASGFDCYNRDV